MEKRLDNLPIRPNTVPEMIRKLQKMWQGLNLEIDFPPYTISMPSRIKAVIAANGGYTEY